MVPGFRDLGAPLPALRVGHALAARQECRSVETKTVSGRGESFLQETLENHRRDGWKVEHLTRSFGKFVVVFTKDVSTPPPRVAPPRPDQ